jgi:hypothetical protein
MRNDYIFTIGFNSLYPRHNIIGTITDEPQTESTFIREDGTVLYVYDCKVCIEKATTPDGVEHEQFVSVDVICKFTPDSKYHIITRSNLQRLYGTEFEGQSLRGMAPELIESDDPVTWKHQRYYNDGIYNVRNKYLKPMSGEFNRDLLTSMFCDIIANHEEVLERLEDVLNGNHVVGDFRIWSEDEEVYMLHLPSGTIVGWYKFYHYGRSNFCNKSMNESDLNEFFWLLRNQLLGEDDEPEEPREPRVIVKEIDQSAYEQLVENMSRKISDNSVYGLFGQTDVNSFYPSARYAESDDDSGDDAVVINGRHPATIGDVFETIKEWAKTADGIDYTAVFGLGDKMVSFGSKVMMLRKPTEVEILDTETGDIISITPERAEFSRGSSTGMMTCVNDPDELIEFESPIITLIYREFFAHGPQKKAHDFYGVFSWDDEDEAK